MLTFSIILNTFNRATLLPRAIRGVLAQTLEDFEVIVMDDGSTDTTPDVVASFDDPRIRYIHQANAGLCSARNTGASHALGDWLVFLDDDDEPRPTWLANVAAYVADPGCGLVCAGVEVVFEHHTEVLLPENLGPLFLGNTVLFQPGAFWVRRSVFALIGGYTPGLASNHQTELALRLVPALVADGWTVQSVPALGLRMYRQPPGHRPLADAAAQYSGIPFILERHAERFRSDAHAKARFLSVAGVSAVRLGHHREARRFLAGAVRATPRDVRAYARLALACVPPVAHRVWKVGNRRPTTT